MKRVFQAETFCKSKKNIAASFIFVQDNKNGCFAFFRSVSNRNVFREHDELKKIGNAGKILVNKAKDTTG